MENSNKLFYTERHHQHYTVIVVDGIEITLPRETKTLPQMNGKVERIFTVGFSLTKVLGKKQLKFFKTWPKS